MISRLSVDELLETKDLKSNNLSLDEAIDVAHNRPLWRLMSTFGGTHSKWCMPQKNEKSIIVWMENADRTKSIPHHPSCYIWQCHASEFVR